MKKVWEIFPKLTEAVKKDHAGKNCGHHPFSHALMVAQYCLIIAEDDKTGHMAAAGGLAHNTDRHFPKEETRSHIEHLMGLTDFPFSERQMIVNAVMNHDKPNDPNDSLILVCLKDADRLANIGPFEIVARAALGHPSLPLFDPKYILKVDPESTYLDPKTIFRDGVQSTLEWKTWLRLPKAIEIAKPCFEGLEMLQELTAMQLSQTGLDQYLD